MSYRYLINMGQSRWSMDAYDPEFIILRKTVFEKKHIWQGQVQGDIQDFQ